MYSLFHGSWLPVGYAGWVENVVNWSRFDRIDTNHFPCCRFVMPEVDLPDTIPCKSSWDVTCESSRIVKCLRWIDSVWVYWTWMKNARWKIITWVQLVVEPHQNLKILGSKQHDCISPIWACHSFYTTVVCLFKHFTWSLTTFLPVFRIHSNGSTGRTASWKTLGMRYIEVCPRAIHKPKLDVYVQNNYKLK